MKFQVTSTVIEKIKSDAVIISLFEGVKVLEGTPRLLDKALKGAIGDLIKAGEFKGKIGEIQVVHTLGCLQARLVVIVGLGQKREFHKGCLRNAMGEAVRILRKHNCSSAVTELNGVGIDEINQTEFAQMIVEGFMLGAYRFTRHLTKKDKQKEIAELIIVAKKGNKLEQVKKGIERGKVIAEAVIMARDMVNEPGNYMTPTDMADTARKVAAKNGLEIMVWERDRMEQENMGALLAVSQGSHQAAKFIVLKYNGSKMQKKVTGFVGKGLTFDSGGISLKPQDYMADMKGDMAGGAAVIAAIGAIAALKLKINVMGIIPATENLPGGKALKPGDVVKASNGKTIEVVNTDAEGRLILSDALSFAVKQGISQIVDLATLTGACHVALGDMYAGVFSNNQSTADHVLKAGKEADEPLWQLPLPNDYKELNKSDIADVKNSGGRYGGAITAALFLQEFVGKTPWVHLDIAAPFMAEKTKGALVKGATGFGVRTLIELAIDWSK